MSERRPVRVARIIARLNVGGPARHVSWLTSAMQHGEFETALVTGTVPRGEEDMSGFAAALGITPIVIPEMSREISPRDAITVWKLVRFFLRFRPDIVHTHTAKAGAAGRAAGFLYRLLTRRRVRFVHTYHGHIFHSYYGRLKTRAFLAIEKLLARKTDAIIVLSEQQRREIHEDFRVGRTSQFRIIPLGIDLSEIENVRHDAARDATVVGFAGRLTAIKNIDLFLRVAARLRGENNVRFVLYGDGTEREALERRANELRLGDRLTFAGTHPAAEIYASVDIVALTSLNEGTPLTLIEAMAAGLPSISTAVGGVVDVLGKVEQHVEDNGIGYDIRERGVTVASNDEAGFSAGLRRLISDAALRRSLGESGRAFARATYSKERLIEDMIRLYREFRS